MNSSVALGEEFAVKQYRGMKIIFWVIAIALIVVLTDTSTAGGQYGCSTLAVHSPDGAALFGHNFDWEECNIMLVHTIPKNGYESFATYNLIMDTLRNWEMNGFLTGRGNAILLTKIIS